MAACEELCEAGPLHCHAELLRYGGRCPVGTLSSSALCSMLLISKDSAHPLKSKQHSLLRARETLCM